MSHNYKLRLDQVLEIKNQLAHTKRAMKEIGEEYGVSLSTIRVINQGGTHSDVGSFSYPIRKKAYVNVNPPKTPARKISDEQALEIYFKIQEGATRNALAVEYGVSQPLIDKILNRSLFRHIEMFED